MVGHSHVMSDISYENTEYLSLSFHDISEKKKGGGTSGDIHCQNRANENPAVPLNIIPYGQLSLLERGK